MSSFSLLADRFFERFFYNDLISDADDPQSTAGNLMAILAFPGFLSLYLIPKYYVTLAQAPLEVRNVAVFSDRVWLLTFSMIILGLLTTLEWDQLLPDRRDFLILRPLPVRLSTIFSAQAFALLRFALLFFFVVNAASSLFFPLAAAPYAASIFEGFWFALAHVISVGAGALFMVLALLCLQGLLLNLAPQYWLGRLWALAQNAAAMALTAGLVLLPGAGWVASAHLRGELDASWAPPLWFAALGDVLAGGSMAPGLALAAVAALAAAGAGAAATFFLGYRRHVKRTLEARASDRLGDLLGALPVRLFSRALADSRARAGFRFTVLTLLRSQRQRLCFGAFVAAGAALALALDAGKPLDLSAAAGPPKSLLAALYVFVGAALVGLRVAIAVPAEPTANWVFRMAAGDSMQPFRRGMRLAAWFILGVPVALGSTAFVALVWGRTAAAVHLLVFGVIFWAVAGGLAAALRKIPFTCPYKPRGPSSTYLWTGAVAAFAAFVGAAASTELLLLSEPWRAPLLLLSVALCGAGVTLLPRPDPAPIFEEEDPHAFQRLRLE